MLSVASPARERLKQKLQKEIEDADTFILPTPKHQNLSGLLLPAILALALRYKDARARSIRSRMYITANLTVS